MYHIFPGKSSVSFKAGVLLPAGSFTLFPDMVYCKARNVQKNESGVI